MNEGPPPEREIVRDGRPLSDITEELLTNETIARPTSDVSRPLKVREVIRMLEKSGWRHVRTSGGHRIFQSVDGRFTVVSGKSGDDVRTGTYRAVLRRTGIEEPEK